MREISYFKLEITPWIYASEDPRADEWRISVVVNGEAIKYTQIFPKIPFNKSELETYLRSALVAYERAHER